MAKITYVEAGGSSKIVKVPTGWSLMQGALSNATGWLCVCRRLGAKSVAFSKKAALAEPRAVSMLEGRA